MDLELIAVTDGFVIRDWLSNAYCGRDKYWARFKENASPFRDCAAASAFLDSLV